MVAVMAAPADVKRDDRWLRLAEARDGRVDVLCLSETVRSRVVQAGVPRAVTAVVRPGVDVAAIERTCEASRRAEIGLPPGKRVLLTASPPSRAGGHYGAIWAVAILYQVWPDVRLIIPGTSREQRRLRRFVEQIYCPEIYHLTEDRYTPAELLAVSDMLIVPALEDIPNGWLAQAMAACVPVVGSSVPAVTELIVDERNGFLSPGVEPHTFATRIRTVAESGDTVRRCVETARRQALEMFDVPRCAEAHLKVLDSVLAGRRGAQAGQEAALDA